VRGPDSSVPADTDGSRESGVSEGGVSEGGVVSPTLCPAQDHGLLGEYHLELHHVFTATTCPDSCNHDVDSRDLSAVLTLAKSGDQFFPLEIRLEAAQGANVSGLSFDYAGSVVDTWAPVEVQVENPDGGVAYLTPFDPSLAGRVVRVQQSFGSAALVGNSADKDSLDLTIDTQTGEVRAFVREYFTDGLESKTWSSKETGSGQIACPHVDCAADATQCD
jgi:hypothetical protein